MAQFQNIQFKVSVNAAIQLANIDVSGIVVLDPGQQLNLDCAVFGDDPLFDEVLFRFDRIQVGSDFGTIFRFNADKPLSVLNEDKRGPDEIYAELVLSQNLAPGTNVPVQVIKRAKTPVKQINA